MAGIGQKGFQGWFKNLSQCTWGKQQHHKQKWNIVVMGSSSLLKQLFLQPCWRPHVGEIPPSTAGIWSHQAKAFLITGSDSDIDAEVKTWPGISKNAPGASTWLGAVGSVQGSPGDQGSCAGLTASHPGWSCTSSSVEKLCGGEARKCQETVKLGCCLCCDALGSAGWFFWSLRNIPGCSYSSCIKKE